MERRARITLLFTLLALALTAPAAMANYPTSVNANNPLAYWRLDETSGTAAADASTAPGHVAVPGTYSAGALVNQAPPFAPLNRSVRLTGGETVSAAGPLGAAPLTLELWVKPEQVNREQALVSVGDLSTTGFTIGITKKRKLFFRNATDTINARNVSVAWSTNATPRWTMINVSFNTVAATDTVTFRTNGGAANRTLNIPGGTAPSAVGPITIGDQPGPGQHGMQGNVDEIAFYPAALTLADIQNHFKQTGAPLGITPPSISGTAVVGGTLTANTGTWQNPTSGALSYGFQWLLCDTATDLCDDIVGATADTLPVAAAYEGKSIQLEVTATNVNGSATNSSDEVGPVEAAPTSNVAPHNDALPVIVGIQPYVGRALSSTPGTWSGFPAPTLTQQWERCDAGGGSCVEITGQTGVGYTPAAEDIGSTLRLVVTGANSVGSASAHSAVSSVVPDPTVTPDPGPVDGSDKTGTTTGTTTNGGAQGGTLQNNTTSCLRFTTIPKRLNKKVKTLGRVRIGPVTGSKAGTGAVKLQVRLAKGKKLKSVTWTLDGKKLKTAKQRPYTVSLLPAKAGKAGTHVLRAKLTPKKGKSRTLKTFVLVKAC